MRSGVDRAALLVLVNLRYVVMVGAVRCSGWVTRRMTKKKHRRLTLVLR